jgi:menaquinone-dependent protoporphyrinogen oxidase
MKTAILYTSSHGTTEKVAENIAEILRSGDVDVELISLDRVRNPGTDAFDTVILGTSIHVGRPSGKMQKYVTETENKNVLETKNIGLFVCCMLPEPEKRAAQFERAFPEYLRVRARASGIMGGEFIFEKMNWLERAMIKKIAGTGKSVSAVDGRAIADFAARMKQTF